MKLAVPQQRRSREVTPRPPRRMAVSSAPQPAASPAGAALHPVVQAKLKIGAPNDEYEQEADRVADQVLAAPANSAVRGAPPLIQRLHRASDRASRYGVHQRRRGPRRRCGTPLDPALQQDMEQRFGHDFGQVRVHADSRAAESANAIDALVLHSRPACGVWHRPVCTRHVRRQRFAGARVDAHRAARTGTQRHTALTQVRDSDEEQRLGCQEYRHS